MILPDGAPRRAIGIITPSANIMVERVAISLMRAFPDVDLHFARTPVSGSVDPQPHGYDDEAMLRAAGLLADAAPSVIVWAGSKGVLVGVEKDETLCSAIARATGLRATTPSLALRDRVRRGTTRRAVLVTPYTEPYQRRLINGFARLGIACIAEAHAGIADNLAYAAVGPNRIRAMAHEAMRRAETPPEVVLIWCTNFAGAAVACDLEAELGIAVVDATLLGLRQALTILDVDPSPAEAWGSLFQRRSGDRGHE